jgi:hypothetical protein
MMALVYRSDGNIKHRLHKKQISKKVLFLGILPTLSDLQCYKGKGKGKIVPVLFSTEHQAMKAYWGSGCIAPRLLDLGTRWR